MSSIYARKGRLYFSVKVDGEWKNLPTAFKVGQERQARKVLERIDARLAAGERFVGPLTVAMWAEQWLKQREREVKTWKNDRDTLKLRVLPVLGRQRLEEVRPKDIAALVKGWRAGVGGTIAPKTIYTAYSTICALFRDAALEDLIGGSPCMLKKRELGPKVDANPEWRKSAQFTQDELELLITDERIPEDRRVVYALAGIGGLRHGELAGLRWRDLTDMEPLSMLFISRQYAEELPKGEVCRPVPVHPTLAGMLAEWRAGGWKRFKGRAPTADDLIVPRQSALARRGATAEIRSKGDSWEALQQDLEALGLRQRRFHDFRRTMISLARSNGAVKDILGRATHKPPREVREGYTTFEWPIVCREVAKLQVRRRQRGVVVALAAGAPSPAEEVEQPPSELSTERPTNPKMMRSFRVQMTNTKPGSSPGRATQATRGESEVSQTYAPASPVESVQTGVSGENGRKVENAADPVGQQLERALARWKSKPSAAELERDLFDVLLALKGRA